MCLVPEKSARHLRAEEALDVPPEAVDAGGHGRRLLPPRRGDRVAEGVGFGGGGGGRRRRRRVALDGVFEGAEAVGRRRGRPARRRCRRRGGGGGGGGGRRRCAGGAGAGARGGRRAAGVSGELW